MGKSIDSSIQKQKYGGLVGIYFGEFMNGGSLDFYIDHDLTSRGMMAMMVRIGGESSPNELFKGGLIYRVKG